MSSPPSFTQGLPSARSHPCPRSSQGGLAGSSVSSSHGGRKTALPRGLQAARVSPYPPGASLFLMAEGWQVRVHLLCSLLRDPTSAPWPPFALSLESGLWDITLLHPVACPASALQFGNMPRSLQPPCLRSGCSRPAWPLPGSQGTSSLGVGLGLPWCPH